jgi:dipeptidyl-peptidase-4
MKRLPLILLLAAISQFSNAELLFDIVDGKYRPTRFEHPVSLSDGEYFTRLIDNKAVVKYSYKNAVFVDTVFSIARIKNIKLKGISGYEFSPNENKLLVYTNIKYRYRRTFTADYYVFDIKRGELLPLSDGGSQEVPLFSPDSRYIAFARENNLFIKKLDFNTESAVTTDGQPGKIINGTPDWVYEEEFERTRHFVWSPDSKLLAFLKFNENDVPLFTFQKFGAEKNVKSDIELYPSEFSFKYPKAGQVNSKVSVCVFDDFNKTTRVMKISEPNEDFYVPRIQWTNNNEQLFVYKLNRNQNRLDILTVNPRSTISKLVLRMDDKRYIDYQIIDDVQFTSDNQFFFMLSEQNGYRHIYQYKINGTLAQQITKGNWDVTAYYGYDESKKVIYYQSAEVSPMQRDVFSIDMKGKKTRLTDGKGTHNAVFNDTFTCFVDMATSLTVAGNVSIRNNSGKLIRELANNQKLEADFASLNLPQKEFFSYTTSENVKLNGWMLKPVNFNQTTKYPVLMVQYSGPNSQEVLDKWSVGWEYFLATKGYVVACVDGRGTGARGEDFRKITYQQNGILEAKDQVETAKYLGSQTFVDKDRIAIWGWSYGGSVVLWAMSTGEQVFKAGISVAPVTDWRLYNTAYTERFMNRPQENFRGYENTSAIMQADKLNGRLLIIHGTADDNVHYQNTLLFTAKLVEAGKQFEMQIYTDKNHSILGKQARRHLYQRMYDFLEANLK